LDPLPASGTIGCMATRILAFAGSARAGSYNKQLLAVTVEGARAAGAEVTHVDLREFALPLYDGDLEREHGLPDAARRLRALFHGHSGLLLACPEYNSSITGLLKNTIDWVTRDERGQGTLDAFDGKVAGLVSASPGALGGLRGLVHVRQILGNIRVLVIPQQFALSRAHEAFDPTGALEDPKQAATAGGVGRAVAELLRRLGGERPS
jgi:NAD(P)H-dependent FMN reductase